MDDLEDLSRRAARAQNGDDRPRVGPEPWFIGSNTRLAGVIIAIVALLIVVRLVTSVWAVEEAWEWWRHRPVSARLPVPAAAPPVSLDLPPIASQVRVATAARGDETRWITPDDYPPASLSAGEEGRALVRWQIERDGRVRRCGVVESSGYPRLDNATCAAIIRRARYEPARDARGAPIVVTKQRAIRWLVPRD